MSEELPAKADLDLDLLKRTVAKTATTEEFQMFAEFCKSTGLNPFKKEIWFIKANNQVQMMTGINGFYAIANQHPAYDGTEIEIVEENGALVKAVARVWRKDRRFPSTAEAYLSEYGKNYGNWKTMPRVMLSKCAESMALRKAFPQELNGLYSQEEMPREYEAPPVTIDVVVEEKPPREAEKVTDLRKAAEIAVKQTFPGRFGYALPLKKKGKDMEAVRAALKQQGFKYHGDLKFWFGDRVIDKLAEYIRLKDGEWVRPVGTGENLRFVTCQETEQKYAGRIKPESEIGKEFSGYPDANESEEIEDDNVPEEWFSGDAA